MENKIEETLLRISVLGVVQGVGFRPFIYQLAHKYNLRGWVCNTSGAVKIEVEGAAKDIERFLKDIPKLAPSVAHIEEIKSEPGIPVNYEGFEIRPSQTEEDKYQLVSPDIATCPKCLHEIFDPFDRRYRYPFTNCTNCGPRFTIINDIPYDRPNTTMSGFTMCPECQSEYDDPANRRFHAQPNACPVCGPQVTLADSAGASVTCDDAILEAASILKKGAILAVKGLGGFLLACDATNDSAVNRLRERKHRPAKPLAVMVASLLEARKHAVISDEEARLLSSPAAPIVLVKWKPESTIAKAIAPGLNYVGLMLPYTPLHHLLIRDMGRPLVMTSGNISEEPIAKDNDEALQRLGGIADYFLLHNRDIRGRYDDSVMLFEAGSSRFARRARGFAPHPVKLANPGGQILACGAEEKNTFCLTRDNYAFVSQHIGDMENLETMDHFTSTLGLYEQLFRIKPQIIVQDLHPEYLPTKYAKELAVKEHLPLFPVQHHHAHIASCMADNAITGKVIGVALDGTGFGTDGCIWGGEFLAADFKGFERLVHLEYLPLPGGAQAVKKPARTALGYMLALGISPDKSLPVMQYVTDEEQEIIREQVKKKLNAPLTSSMGRLFDAVAALTGVRGVIEYEAQAAIDLETSAGDAPEETEDYPFSLTEENSVTIIKIHDLLAALIKDIHDKISKEAIAARFHNTIARMILEVCQHVSAKTGLKKAALSGGVFQNRLLLRKAVAMLESNGYEVYTHHQVPCNDGGISLGQAAIAQFTDAKR
jgi:hydrogenase maturation protein HypF